MKKLIAFTAAVCTLLFSANSVADEIQGSSGTLIVKGLVTGTSCQLSTDTSTGGGQAVLDLHTVTTKDVTSVPSHEKDFVLKLTNNAGQGCDKKTIDYVQYSYNGNRTTDGYIMNTLSGAEATNAAIALQDASGNALDLTGTKRVQVSDNTIRIKAGYVKPKQTVNGSAEEVIPGRFQAGISYIVVYH